ncbi:hypothetical protein CSB20_00240 [bacterium DOLZORAL124_64_63]|nr:MAG: hypothetical protein CSB20_00240 [bacterium DOLZORAL124_64_63]
MALEGKLSDFNLAEILQLISSQQKSGFLNLEATRDMVFIFDKGMLISTRDRRSRSRDPLESFLLAYGFFTEEQWKHVEFVAQNSSLDLAEILVSENLLSEDELTGVLRSLAQEMATKGMKLRRGSYHFNPTKGTPPGVRSRVDMDVQGLLMESARRLDEEQLLREALPNPGITFLQGNTPIPEQTLSSTGRHIMGLALAGLSLGRIIRQGRAESFVVRDLLKTWCEEGYLVIDRSQDNSEQESPESATNRSLKINSSLRRAPSALLFLLMLFSLGWLRWSVPAAPLNGRAQALREAQLRNEITSATTLYRYREGTWPESLELLVRQGALQEATLQTVQTLGWQYTRDSKRDSYALSS